jgi:hypothetical protein
MRDPALAARLASFSIDDGTPALTFTARLARENRWAPAHAHRVVGEYLRFLYLATVSPDTLTPSIAVDQAWHLHLCYTRSYWHHLCRDTIGRDLHHGPTRGGARENHRYHESYERTLRLYAEEYGTAPPADIWPSASLRFAADASPVTIVPRDHIVLSRARVRRAIALTVLAPLSLLTVGALATLKHGSTWAVGLFLGFFLFVAVLAVRQAAKNPSKKRDPSSSCGTGGCGHSTSSDDGGAGDSGCGSGCGGD